MRQIITLILIIFCSSYSFNSMSGGSPKENIEGLSSFDATWSGEPGHINIEQDFCVYSSTNDYKVKAETDNGKYRVYDGSNFMNFSIRWNDVPNTNTGLTKLRYNQYLTNQTSNANSTRCSDVANSQTARVQVRFAEGQLQKRSAGNYSANLILTVAAE